MVCSLLTNVQHCGFFAWQPLLGFIWHYSSVWGRQKKCIYLSEMAPSGHFKWITVLHSVSWWLSLLDALLQPFSLPSICFSIKRCRIAFHVDNPRCCSRLHTFLADIFNLYIIYKICKHLKIIIQSEWRYGYTICPDRCWYRISNFWW